MDNLEERFRHQLSQYSSTLGSASMQYPTVNYAATLPSAYPLSPPSTFQNQMDSSPSWGKKNSKLIIGLIVMVIIIVIVFFVLKHKKKNSDSFEINNDLTLRPASLPYQVNQQQQQQQQQQNGQKIQVQQQQQPSQGLYQRPPQPQYPDSGQRLPTIQPSTGGYPTPPLLIHPDQQRQDQNYQQQQTHIPYQAPQVNQQNPTGAQPISASGNDNLNDPNFTPL